MSRPLNDTRPTICTIPPLTDPIWKLGHAVVELVFDYLNDVEPRVDAFTRMRRQTAA